MVICCVVLVVLSGDLFSSLQCGHQGIYLGKSLWCFGIFNGCPVPGVWRWEHPGSASASSQLGASANLLSLVGFALAYQFGSSLNRSQLLSGRGSCWGQSSSSSGAEG